MCDFVVVVEYVVGWYCLGVEYGLFVVMLSYGDGLCGKGVILCCCVGWIGVFCG